MKATERNLIIRNIPDELRSDFKAQCKVEGTAMSRKIIKLIQRHLRECQKRNHITLEVKS